VRHLLAADRVRFGRRRDLWFLVALVPVVMLIMFLAGYHTLTTPPLDNFFIDPPDPVAQAQLHDQMLADWHQRLATELPAYAFPAGLLLMADNVAPLILLAIYLATALVVGEFEWGTVRTLHLTSQRGRTLAVRVGLILGLMGLVTAIGLLFAAIAPFFMSFEGTPLQQYAAPAPDLWTAIALRLLIVLPFMALPVLLGVLTRSMGITFVLLVLFFAADLGLMGAPFWPGSPLPWVPAVTLSGAINRLLGPPEGPMTWVPWGVSLAALLAWGIVPILVAIGRFRRLDISE